jgi:predicted CoA-binding protein
MGMSLRAYAPDDERLGELLDSWKTIAVVGLSADPFRPAFGVARYLKDVGYRVIPVHPEAQEVLGERAFPTLADVDEPIDLVDVFRRPEFTPEHAREAVAVGAKGLWLQEGIVNDEARQIAEDAGLDVVMGLCIKTVHRWLRSQEAAR